MYHYGDIPQKHSVESNDLDPARGCIKALLIGVVMWALMLSWVL